MLRTRGIAGCLLFPALFVLSCASMRPADPFGRSTQLIVVTTADWDATDGTLTRYERDGGAWMKVGTPIEVVVGRTGLAWGSGLPLPRPSGGPVKEEGDGKAPAGLFRLTSLFGDEPAPPSPRMPYIAATPTVECVDDPLSAQYNRIVDTTRVPKTWSSSEMMRRDDEQYRRGVFVAHNSDPAVPRGGSCIFLHIWTGPGSTTAGCTAMRADDLSAVIDWLDSTREPLLLQLPEAQLESREWRPGR